MKLWYRGGKRVFDVLVSMLLLFLLAPFFLFAGIVVLVALGRPVLFIQRRPGLAGVPFNLLKFRTMRLGHNRDGTDLPDACRITRAGNFLRRWSLDELPQLLNVLVGQMSLVGPRPLLMEYLPLYSEAQRNRHAVRPGLTGLAQVNGRNAISWNEKFELDLKYVRDLSFVLDMKILMLTARKVFVKHGVTQDGHVTAAPFQG